MIELKNNTLRFSFPEVHKDAHMTIQFQRTLRIPDDDEVHFLPPGLGAFPLRHVDDFATRLPQSWREHGGIMLPMFQSEAMWLNFSSPTGYPFVVKIATGKINAVTGESWRHGINRDPQDYLTVPTQPWLDGFCVKKGEVRQFVAMPLGDGYTTEEQLTGKAVHGGLQIEVFPLKAAEWEKMQKTRSVMHEPMALKCCIPAQSEMGLAPGGRMKQKIHEDPHELDAWDLRHSSRCFAHIANSLHWRAITGEAPPTMPPTAAQYTKAGLPWFDHYSEAPAVEGADKFKNLKTVNELGQEKGESPLPENEPVKPEKIIVIKSGSGKDVVREGSF
jgi:hypothetical protein